jgi:hypothetical protein
MYVAWPPRETLQLRQNLDELRALVRGENSQDLSPELRSWLARLLIVRSCGYLEKMVVLICRGYVDQKSGGRVRAFAQANLQRLNANVSSSDLVSLTQRFDPSLATELENFLDAEEIRDDLDFLVNRRNRIAHGENEGITPRRALDLVEAVYKIVDWFILSFNPLRP